jgi:two-component system KDP operon response regulator KdpE
LTTTEYRLLVYLLQHANRVVSFNHILEQVWGAAYQDSVDYVHVYISRLRQKLEEYPKHPRYLLTVHGVGYRLQLPVIPPMKSTGLEEEESKLPYN